MKPKTLSLGICIIVLIALAFIAGCTSPSTQNTPAQAGTPAATVVTTVPAAMVTPAGSAVPASAVNPSATTDVWVNFKEPTTAAGAVTTGEPTVMGTEVPTPVITETPFVEVTLTEPPTPVPTTPSVNDTCSNIGGNICQANQTCSGAYIKTTDEPKCCAGVCQ
jgi:hypothetical protein